LKVLEWTPSPSNQIWTT
jgi:hypothetical protein